jgi:hypothetical protein
LTAGGGRQGRPRLEKGLPPAALRRNQGRSDQGLRRRVGCAGQERPSSMSSRCTSRARAVKGPGTRVVLAEHTGFPWDRVCILDPYTPDDKVDSLTGAHSAARQAHDINRGDFGPEVVGTCYSRDEANFSVRVPPQNSWGNIGPGGSEDGRHVVSQLEGEFVSVRRWSQHVGVHTRPPGLGRPRAAPPLSAAGSAWRASESSS